MAYVSTVRKKLASGFKSLGACFQYISILIMVMLVLYAFHCGGDRAFVFSQQE